MEKNCFKGCFCAKVVNIEESCPPCGENALQGQKGVIKKEPLFNNPPSARCATSPAGGEGNGQPLRFGFTLRPSSSRSTAPSSSRNVLMRDIGAAHTLYPAFIAARRVGVTERVAHGFTLIELLVVVLIIGILAAVALPQYNKAVYKAQGREVLVALKAIDMALHTYALEHGSLEHKAPKAGSLEMLYGISIPANELGIQMPDLKHFEYSYPAGSLNTFLGINAAWGVEFIRNTGEAIVHATYDINTGKRLLTTCGGEKCTLYFDCRIEEEMGCPIGGFTAQNCPVTPRSQQKYYLDY